MKVVTAKDQIARRRKRAGKELRSVENLGENPVFSSFRVVSQTRREFTVRIRSVDSLINSCSCPDYRTNTIGTCKHIEGVLEHLRSTLLSFEGLSCSPPPVCELFLHRGEYNSIRMTPADPELISALGKGFLRHFGCDGELVESGVHPGKLAGEISLMRELSLPPESPEDAEPPPSMRSIEGMLATVESLLTLGRELLLSEKV